MISLFDKAGIGHSKTMMRAVSYGRRWDTDVPKSIA
jgi:hypothetical protein